MDFWANPCVRVDAETKVKGRRASPPDLTFQILPHATLVFSTIAKGKVSKIDTERAKRTPDVLEVLILEEQCLSWRATVG